MSDTNNLNAVIIETIRDVKGGVSKSVDFLLEQAPDVANQLLAFKFYESVITGSTLLIIGVVFALILRKGWRYMMDNDWEPLQYFSCIVPLILFGFALSHAVNAVKIKVAPKLFLIEYTANLLKDN